MSNLKRRGYFACIALASLLTGIPGVASAQVQRTESTEWKAPPGANGNLQVTIPIGARIVSTVFYSTAGWPDDTAMHPVATGEGAFLVIAPVNATPQGNTILVFSSFLNKSGDRTRFVQMVVFWTPS